MNEYHRNIANRRRLNLRNKMVHEHKTLVNKQFKERKKEIK